MITMTDTTKLTPVEIDRFLSDNYQDQARVWASIAGTVKTIDRLRHSKYGTLKEIDRFVAQEEALRAENNRLIVEAAPYQAEYSRRPWNRFFLVTNGNGHVHNRLNCPTCFATTQYSWLVDLADKTEADMVELWGERACTVCFPSAPTNPLYHRPAKVDREAKAAREAEKAAKQAAKDAKAITDVDGSPLKVDGDTLRTKVAARNALSQEFQYLVFYGGSKHADNVRKLVPALEAAGIDWKPVAERAIKKATKEAHVDPSNPYHLSPEQITAQVNEIIANTAAANTLLREVSEV